MGQKLMSDCLGLLSKHLVLVCLFYTCRHAHPRFTLCRTLASKRSHDNVAGKDTRHALLPPAAPTLLLPPAAAHGSRMEHGWSALAQPGDASRPHCARRLLLVSPARSGALLSIGRCVSAAAGVCTAAAHRTRPCGEEGSVNRGAATAAHERCCLDCHAPRDAPSPVGMDVDVDVSLFCPSFCPSLQTSSQSGAQLKCRRDLLPSRRLFPCALPTSPAVTPRSIRTQMVDAA